VEKLNRMSEPETVGSILNPFLVEDRDKMRLSSLANNSFLEFNKEGIESSIPKRFEEEVENFPTRLAIKTQSQELTYEELNKIANSIARVICAKGSKGPETVALYFEPGVKMIAAILAVLKSGKIWVPLDTTHPGDRISYILQDSQAKLILCENKNLFSTKESIENEHDLINLDEIDYAINNDNLDISVQPNDVAHIIYTSGSTGQSKGVVHNHRLILHNIKGHTNSFRIGPDDRISLFSSLSHIAGISDMFRALLNGAALLPFNLRMEGFGYLATWLIEEKITIYHSVPSVFRQLINTLNRGEAFPDLRIIHLGGEEVLRHDVVSYQKHFSSDCMLVVILGATEAPTFRQNFITKDTHLVEDSVPVGQPVLDKEILLLDRHGRQIKTNQVGEIAVRSHYLASGYWNKPELTSKVFVPDFAGGNKRIYRTGDLGQLLPDGTLIYFGRQDNQVKIGGQRIEIAEIENVLLEHSLLKICAVILVGNIEEERYLAAYLEPINRQKPNVTELQNYLRQKLPSYMIPSKFIFLKSMPFLPNGKIDRLALPTPDRLRPELVTDYVAPKSDIERSIADIWQEILKIDKIGINDDFFELGGHSLLATQLLSRIHKIFKITLPLKRIFEASTVKTIAILIDMIIRTATNQKRITNSAPEEREKIVI